jgi:hypothetical protein
MNFVLPNLPLSQPYWERGPGGEAGPARNPRSPHPQAYPIVDNRFPDISYAKAGMSCTPDASIHVL